LLFPTLKLAFLEALRTDFFAFALFLDFAIVFHLPTSVYLVSCNLKLHVKWMTRYHQVTIDK
jgi:hypothetical protein